MLGQQEGVPTWVAGGTTISGTLVLGWFAWHTITRTIPELQRNFREELATERAENARLHSQTNERHEREISEWRKMLELSQKMLHEAITEDRRAVHDIKDVASTVIAKTELKERGG